MKRAIWHGGKDIRIEEKELPKAAQQEVVVKVRAVGICGSELHAFLGTSKRRVPPLVMGHEFAGEVAYIGDGVMSLKVGDRVAVQPIIGCGVCKACQRGEPNLCAPGPAYSWCLC